MNRISKIVITGGPCAGKSTAMSWIRNAFSHRGYTVLIVPETATELITGGVAPWTCQTNADYQKCQVELQLTKERLFEQAASGMASEKILIVCDRGVMDNRAYMNEEEFEDVLRALDGDLIDWRDRYDAVFHLVTAANGAEEFYTKANNAARYESVEEAVQVNHPYEIERKFLIAYPDVSWLESNPLSRKVEIEQIYLTSAPGEEIRIRKRGENGHFVYYETHKKPLNGLKRISTERRLSGSEYRHLMKNADPSRHTIRKTRYCLAYEHQYFEIDLYPFWTDQAILEIELMDGNEKICFPPQIDVIREVTDDPAYKNAALAKNAARQSR